MNRVARMMMKALLLAALLPAAAWAQEGKGDVVYVPTPQNVVDEMLDMAKVGPNDFLIDLGSGDGRIVITAAKKFGTRGFGVDLDPVLVKEARANARREGVADRVQFREENLFSTDLSSATVITSYLLPEMNLKLRPTLMTLKPGTRVVTHDYDIDGWYPDEEKTISVPGKDVGDPGKSYIFFYIVPATIAGRWESLMQMGGRSVIYEFEFDQSFQRVTGDVRVDNRPVRLPLFEMRGERLAFEVDAPQGKHRFQGSVKGHTIQGTVTIDGGKPLPWTAQLKRRDEMRVSAIDAGEGRIR
jgi:hypothetical protein